MNVVLTVRETKSNVTATEEGSESECSSEEEEAEGVRLTGPFAKMRNYFSELKGLSKDEMV